MKIDNNNPIFLVNNPKNPLTKAADFESMLLNKNNDPSYNSVQHDDKTNDTSVRKEDDFYWLHQNQLQQSALTFHPVINKKIVTTGNHLAIAGQKHLLETKAIAVKATIEINHPIEKILKQPIPTAIPNREIAALITSLKTALHQFNCHSDIKKTQEIIMINSPKQTINNKGFITPTLIKKYQLFLSDQQAELTLNTSDLSQQQTNELQRMIKNWLMNKGYVLKQLMINGVKQ